MHLIKNHIVPFIFLVFSFLFYSTLEYFFPLVGYGVIIMRPIFLLVVLAVAYFLDKVKRKWAYLLVTILGNSCFMLVFLPQEGCSTLVQIREYLNGIHKFEQMKDLDAFLGKGTCGFDELIAYHKYGKFLKNKRLYTFSFFRKGERVKLKKQRFLICIDSLGKVFTQGNTPLILGKKKGLNFEFKTVMEHDTIEIKLSPFKEKFSSNSTPKIIGQIKKITGYKYDGLTPFFRFFLRKLEKRTVPLLEKDAQEELKMETFLLE